MYGAQRDLRYHIFGVYVIAKSEDMQPATEVTCEGGIASGGPHTDDGVAGDKTCRADLRPGKSCKEFLEVRCFCRVAGVVVVAPANGVVSGVSLVLKKTIFVV